MDDDYSNDNNNGNVTDNSNDDNNNNAANQPLPKRERKKPTRKVYENPVPGRLNALRQKMAEAEISAVLIKSPESRRYFSGFVAEDHLLIESSGVLLITEDRQVLLTDGRYTLQATREASLYEVKTYTRDFTDLLKNSLGSAKRLAVEQDYITMSFYKSLVDHLSGVNIEFLPFSLGEFRIVKNEQEIDLISRAVRITEQALGDLWKELEPGVPERWAANFLDIKFREYGAQGPAFPSIIAAGTRAALPHAIPGRKKIGQNEMVVIDIGARYKGYASDMTRTYVPSTKAVGWQRSVYNTVREAQLKALDFLKEGVTGAEVDNIAREHITDEGYGEYFNHSLGHGVGLLVHEEPRLSPYSHTPLKAGSLVTVEPGIYIPNRGGVRLEELTLITKTGNIVLNKDDHFYEF
jgi:Xaa-Pro aminopeptidase